MKRLVLLLLALVLCLCSCSNDGDEIKLPDGATTIEGLYVSEELPVGYYFSKDGFGIQYIGGEPYRIRYYILDGKIHIENYSVENGNTKDFIFEQSDENILIGGLKYVRQNEENSQKSIDNAG